MKQRYECLTNCSFEKALKDKLAQRSNAKLSEESTLVKMFKFFDYANTGTVDVNQFARVLEKTGMYYSAEQVKSLFKSYDTHSIGCIDYRQLAAAIFNGKAESSRPMSD